MRATRFCMLAGLTALLGLGGCDGMTELALTGGGLFGGAMTGDDCPTAAAGEDDRSCRVEEQAQALGPAPIVETPLYCYRTLAVITCYDSPDPQASPSRRVQ
jgi:hypothetical protein